MANRSTKIEDAMAEALTKNSKVWIAVKRGDLNGALIMLGIGALVFGIVIGLLVK
jgi:hypothetical protein